VEHAFHDVVEELFDQILDLESDRGDFLQVRFWPVVEKLRINAFNRYTEALNRAKDAVTWDSVAGYEQRSGEGAEMTGGRHRPADSESLQKARLSAEQRAAYLEAAREVLDHVDEPYKTAFVLRHYYDWPIETKKPGLPSISRYFGKTPRTINDWLKRADEMIERRKGEMA
jgi:DNA-directed RNA polymerase specialized sigma24 family protein